MTDINATDMGTLVRFEWSSAAGREWIRENVDAPHWARTRDGFIADHGPAQDIIDGAHADGLAVEVTR